MQACHGMVWHGMLLIRNHSLKYHSWKLETVFLPLYIAHPNMTRTPPTAESALSATHGGAASIRCNGPRPQQRSKPVVQHRYDIAQRM